MTFINKFKIINKPIFVKNNLYMLSKNNITIYNPIIGSNLGIPLNLLQYIYTTSHYGENIINNDLILLQFAIGIFTYGTDRFLDAIEYDNYTYSNNSIYNLEKSNYYDYLLKNKNLNIILLLSSYLYILSLLINNI